MSIRTRFAPSPTGVLHVGSVRTALFCWLYARHHGGQFILRIEDTDRERSTQENVNAILDGMSWLGLEADEGPFYQTQRHDRYKEVRDQLLESGDAYYCYCSREELDELRATVDDALSFIPTIPTIPAGTRADIVQALAEDFLGTRSTRDRILEASRKRANRRRKADRRDKSEG